MESLVDQLTRRVAWFRDMAETQVRLADYARVASGPERARSRAIDASRAKAFLEQACAELREALAAV